MSTVRPTATGKQVTPRWVDWLLLALILAIPVLYALGFSVNAGPSMSHLGWFYRTSWGEQPQRVGQIVRFAQPDQPIWRKYVLASVKRVAEITPEGYVVEGDNADLSRDSRDWDQAIHPSRTSGVVSWCWSPKRAWRARTPEGRLLNYLQFRYLPKMYVVAEGGRAVIRETDGFFLVSPDSRTPLELPDLHWGSAAGAVAWSPEGDHVAVLYSNGVAVFGRDGQLLWSLPLELAEWNTIRWTAKRIEIVLADSPLGYAIDPLTKRVEGLNIMAP